MNKERANEIMKELKENCSGKECCECVFYHNDNYSHTFCKLKQTRPDNYKIEGILDEKEKEYLSNIVKPFRNKVKHIKKVSCTDEYIKIVLSGEVINLPLFEKDTMYKGMENNKNYTLEELGI